MGREAEKKTGISRLPPPGDRIDPIMQCGPAPVLCFPRGTRWCAPWVRVGDGLGELAQLVAREKTRAFRPLAPGTCMIGVVLSCVPCTLPGRCVGCAVVSRCRRAGMAVSDGSGVPTPLS